jgi:formylglycine-generating enzyme required for sulfatase activity
MNSDNIRVPSSGVDRSKWLAVLEQWRSDTVNRNRVADVRFDYDGERAYVRLREWVAKDLDLKAGETIAYRFELKGISGKVGLSFAFDFLDRNTGEWKGWSSVVESLDMKTDQTWRSGEVRVSVPPIPKGCIALPIFGQDLVKTKEKGVWEVRNVVLSVPSNASRSEVAKRSRKLDLSLYDRKDLRWNSTDITCAFLFAYDSEYFNREKQTYDVERFVADQRLRIGDIDSVQIWQAYPRIGIDPRNQFDFYRDMAGGVAGVRDLVRRFHKLGIKVWLPYNPWDTGTRREPVSDAVALAQMLKDTEGDGLFLDTMNASPTGLRSEVDLQRKGVVFEPEIDPSIDELQICTGSWTQWQEDFPEPGLLITKWLEPRHMRHAIRRTLTDHFAEIESAFFNGSGVMYWENVFSSWNPWSTSNRFELARASRAMRLFKDLVCVKRPNPFVPCLRSLVYANEWSDKRATVFMVVNRGDIGLSGPILTCKREGQAIDVITGKSLRHDADGTIHGSIDRLAAIVVTSDPGLLKTVGTVAAVNAAAAPLAPDKKVEMKLVPVEPIQTKDLKGMVLVPGGKVHLRIEHQRRECGCYADPGLSEAEAKTFTFGIVNAVGNIVHNLKLTLKPYWIDETLVTNGQYEAFLKATGYSPKVKANFLKHWNGPTCPEALRDHPVVYVDLDDARAYAKWAGKRLPTDEEWMYAGQGDDGRVWPWGSVFDSKKCNGTGRGTTPVRQFASGRSPFGCYDMTGNVWQWTESERDDGHTRWCLVRGGSWFTAKGSGWYTPGGAQPLTSHAKFLLASPGLDRCSTIGFRCVADNQGR